MDSLLGWAAASIAHRAVAVGSALVLAIALLVSQSTVADAQTADNVLYFTYDDGPHPTTTQALLDLFDDYDGKATFFVVGEWLERYPEIVTETHDRGHSVQNHSRDHPHMTELTDSEIVEQLQYAQERIIETTGVAPTCFRPPFGDTDDRVRSLVESQGLTEELWDISTRDWSQPGVDVIVDTIKAEAFPGAVILLHDGPFSEPRSQAVDATAELLEHFSNLGYRFEALPQCGGGGSGGGGGGSGGGGGGGGGGGTTGDNEVIVRARGNTGEENIDLRINGQVIDGWTNIGTTLTDFTATVPDGVTIDELRVHYTNNGTSSTGGNKNAFIDYVEIDGQRYQAEDPANESRGSWTPSTNCSQGFKSSEWINCNGWIDFAAAVGLTFGGGSGGGTTNQDPIANAGTDQTVTDTDGDGVETVELSGSASDDPDGTIVSYLWQAGSTTLATTADPTIELGVGQHSLRLTVTDDDGATDSDTVVITVEAEPGQPPGGDDVTIVVRARGNTGEENIDLRINGQVVGAWTAIGTAFNDYTVTVPAGTTIDNLRVHYTNNGTTATGGNRNALIDYVEVDGTVYQTEASANESRGSWTPSTNCSQGFKSSEWINCNGWVDYAALAGTQL